MASGWLVFFFFSFFSLQLILQLHLIKQNIIMKFKK